MIAEINTAEPKIDSAFESLISLLTRPDKQDWFQVVNAYVVDVFEMPNIIHFKQHADDEQKKTFCKSVIEAIKLGNKTLLVPETVKGDVKPDAEEIAKAKPEPKKKAEPRPEPDPEQAVHLTRDSILPEVKPVPVAEPSPLETMIVNAVLARMGNVSIPDNVITSKVVKVVQEELDKRWGAIVDMVNKKVDAMQEKVDAFTRTTPPRDVFHVTISAQSEKEMAAVKQIVGSNVSLEELP